MSVAAQLQDVRQVFDSLLTLEIDVARAASLMVDTLLRGGRILACGNGGSAAEAQHFVTELVGRYRSDRDPLPAIYLGGDTGQMSCIANDFSWDEVFARPFQALVRPGDCLLCLSTSGRSSNVVSTLRCAREMGTPSVALLGHGGGIAAELATHPLVIASADTARIQEAHLFLIHHLCDCIEEAFAEAGTGRRSVA